MQASNTEDRKPSFPSEFAIAEAPSIFKRSKKQLIR